MWNTILRFLQKYLPDEIARIGKPIPERAVLEERDGLLVSTAEVNSDVDVESLFGETLTAFDCVVLVQNGFCIRPVVPLQGLIWAPFCSFAHCVSASHSLTKQALRP